ncbi:homoserine kinase [Clostridium guangxiense]|uniref:homoserine kinase n=1 Tax=Clostridium guangxiense TaxID=1662055 RepID=UPI001E3518A9|nr:homoserine kinase [Clostridium guangxiense]MCD2346219.1 homoserine kinase [Clostridium guangxiense]
MVRVRVPATSANMGAGFDTFGIALKLYNEIEVEEVNGETEIKLFENKYDDDFKSNLTYQSIIKTYEYCNSPYKNFKIDMSKSNIPMSRGLGSSAACIVGGIFAANKMLKDKLSVDEMLKIAVSIEGHPDNVAPALMGGMVTSIAGGENIVYSKVNIKSDFKYAAMIPNFKVGTSDARKVLPESFSRSDAVFNISRAAMLVSALNNGENEKLKFAFEDRIHQPYRKKFIHNLDEIFIRSRELGSYGEFISGSGSTLLSIVDENNTDYFKKMSVFLKGLQHEWRILELTMDVDGVSLI